MADRPAFAVPGSNCRARELSCVREAIPHTGGVRGGRLTAPDANPTRCQAAGTAVSLAIRSVSQVRGQVTQVLFSASV